MEPEAVETAAVELEEAATEAVTAEVVAVPVVEAEAGPRPMRSPKCLVRRRSCDGGDGWDCNVLKFMGICIFRDVWFYPLLKNYEHIYIYIQSAMAYHNRYPIGGPLGASLCVGVVGAGILVLWHEPRNNLGGS